MYRWVVLLFVMGCSTTMPIVEPLEPGMTDSELLEQVEQMTLCFPGKGMESPDWATGQGFNTAQSECI